jgi:ribosome biogenesis GTPase A
MSIAIQWFPGHMHLTRQAIAARCKSIDVVIEMLDARLPGSSANPLLAELTRGKASLKLLNKQDLADPAATATWLAHWNAQPGTRALGFDASMPAPARALVTAAREIVPNRGGMDKPVRMLICGIPNVGKSTLINSLAGRKAAKTGDEPGITKNEQKIVLADDVYVFDTPGMLWPRIVVPESGLLLAASGAVGRNAYDEEVVAVALLAVLRRRYRDALFTRFKLDAAAADAMNDEELLGEIGRKRGAMLPGARINRQKAAEIVLNELRSGGFGRVTLETPADYAAWHAEAMRVEAEKAAAREAAKAARRPQRGSA